MAGLEEYRYTKISNTFVIKQKIDEPEAVSFYWNPTHPLNNVLLSITRSLHTEFPPCLLIETNGSRPIPWKGCYWDDELDGIMKSIVEVFLDLRFANPNRTAVFIQDHLWPES